MRRPLGLRYIVPVSDFGLRAAFLELYKGPKPELPLYTSGVQKSKMYHLLTVALLAISTVSATS